MDLHRFDCFEAFEHAVVDVDLKVRLLGPTDGNWRIGHADVDGITVQSGVESVANLCEASGWPTHLMLLISDGHPTPTWLNGESFGPGKIGVLAPRQEFVFRAVGPNEWVTIALPLSSSMFASDDPTGHVLRSWCRATRMVRCAPGAICALREAALLAASVDRSRAGFGRSIIERAVGGLVASRRPQRGAHGRPQISPHELTSAVVRAFRSYDLCETAVEYQLDVMSISGRSLNDFFHRCFGLTPSRYLNLRRLHAIRAALKTEANAVHAVTSVFDAHGYHYSAHSLARYRDLFGESPSQTREAARNRDTG